MQRLFLLMSMTVAVWIHSLLSTLQFGLCCTHCQTNTPWPLSATPPLTAPASRRMSLFFPHSSAAKTQTNTALQQIIKLLPSQHSSFQASRGTLQGFFLKYKSRICAILGITATSGGLGPGFIVHVHRNILCSLLCCLNI